MNRSKVVHGSCNCCVFTFEVDQDDIRRIVNYHCNLCRKMNGASFSTYVAVMNGGFKLTSGDAHISTHHLTESANKKFCALCGTPLYNTNPKYEGIKILYLGAFDDAKAYKPEINIHCESQVDWLGEIMNFKNFFLDPQ